MQVSRKQFDHYILTIVNITFPLFTLYWLYNNLSVNVVLGFLLLSIFVGNTYTIFTHRAWAHRAWIPSPLTNIVGLFLFSLLLTGTSIGWAAVHRKHHRFEDTDSDPHSPYHQSWLRSHFLSTLSDVNLWRYAPDLIRQNSHIWFANYYWYINIGWFGFLYLIDPYLLQYWIAFVGFVLFGMHAINSLLHNTPTWMLPINYKSGASNSLVHSVLVLGNGESWHGNHHQDPFNWKFGRRWYEIDLGAVVISLLIRLGFGKDNMPSVVK